KPRMKLDAPSPEPAASEVTAPEEDWVYEVAAQVAGQPSVAEAPAPTAREVLAAAARATAVEEAEELSARSRVEASLREAATAAEPVVVQEEERVTVAVGARTRGGTANGSASPPTTVGAGAAPSARRGPEVDSRAGRASTAPLPQASRAPAPPSMTPPSSRPPTAPVPARAASVPAAPVPMAAAERHPPATVRTETVVT